MRQTRDSRRLTITRLLFFLNAALWIVLGAAGIVRMGGPSGWILAVLMWGNALVLGWLGWKLAAQRHFIWLIAVGWVALNAVLSVTDQLGWLDWLCLLLNVATLILLVATRTLDTAGRSK